MLLFFAFACQTAGDYVSGVRRVSSTRKANQIYAAFRSLQTLKDYAAQRMMAN